MANSSSGYIIVVADEKNSVTPYKEFFEEKPIVGSLLTVSDLTHLVEVTDVYTTSFGTLFAAKYAKVLAPVPSDKGVGGCKGVTIV